MSKKLTALSELETHLTRERDRLSKMRGEILALNTELKNFSANEYSFAYLRAEKIGIETIEEMMITSPWLPLQINPEMERIGGTTERLKAWRDRPILHIPSGDDFGNDFIHALARTGLSAGWNGTEFTVLTYRIADLFYNLSCMLSAIYCAGWMQDHYIKAIPLSHPEEIYLTAREMTELLESGEAFRYLEIPPEGARSIARDNHPALPPKTKIKPHLTLIKNPDKDSEDRVW